MVMDHVPFRPNKALNDLTKRWVQSQNIYSIENHSFNLNHHQQADMIIGDEKSILRHAHSLPLPITNPSPEVIQVPIEDFILPPISSSSNNSNFDRNKSNSRS